MMNHLTLCLLIGWTTSNLATETQTESFFDHRTWDAGTIPSHVLYHHSFVVTNTTKQPVRSVSTRVSCGCVSASVSKRELAPGEQTIVSATLESRQFTGAINKTIYVLFDQPTLEEVRIQVHAHIVPELQLNPGTLKFGQVKKGKAAEVSAIVSLPKHRMGAIEKATSESALVHVKLEPMTADADTQTYRVTAKLDPSLPAGNWHCTLWLASANKNEPPINIGATVEVVP